jgi:cyclase
MRSPRRRAALALSFVALFAVAAASVPSQRDFSVKEHPVSGPVHVLVGAGGNVGVSVGADGVLLIDDQFPNSVPEIRKALAALAGGNPDVVAARYLINTHHHGDHTGGNADFGKDATVIAHENVRKRLLSSEDQPAPPRALPVVTYEQSCSVHFNGEEIRLVHYPSSHTDGDTVVWFTKSNVVHLGDLFFHGRFPFIDHSSGGSVAGLERSIADVLSKLPADAKLIPGHGGPIASAQDLRDYHAMLVDTQAIVRKAVEAGKGAKEIVGEKLLAKYDKLSWQFISTEKYVEMLVAEAKR